MLAGLVTGLVAEKTRLRLASATKNPRSGNNARRPRLARESIGSSTVNFLTSVGGRSYGSTKGNDGLGHGHLAKSAESDITNQGSRDQSDRDAPVQLREARQHNNHDTRLWKTDYERNRNPRSAREAEGLGLEDGSQPTIQSLEVKEESIQVKNYSATCVCGRVFSHRDKRTLEHNIDEHLVRYHGADAEYRAKLEYVKKEIGQIRKTLNRRYGL